jgi:hypothetical protein
LGLFSIDRRGEREREEVNEPKDWGLIEKETLIIYKGK